MNYDYSKRGYLLPPGCKDLIDVWKLKSEPFPQRLKYLSPLPPVIGEIAVASTTSVLELATLLKQKPFQIIADLMEIGVLANVNQHLNFDLIAWVARKHGYVARKAS